MSDCQWCGEPIRPGEGHPSYLSGAHVECAFRSVSGSVGHILRRCSCHSGNLEDPPGLTKREAARAAFALWQQMTGWYGEGLAL